MLFAGRAFLMIDIIGFVLLTCLSFIFGMLAGAVFFVVFGSILVFIYECFFEAIELDE